MNQKLTDATNKYLGKTIKIVELFDEAFGKRYIGKTGEVKLVTLDPWGDVRIDGTWAGIGLYPDKDKVEIVEEGGN